jgi:hypothetical protein
LLGAGRDSADAVTAAAGLTEDLLRTALIVRRDVGRVSDVIHATVIALTLPKILEPGEVISNRPSLGPGDDKTRPFDLETNRRIAESEPTRFLRTSTSPVSELLSRASRHLRTRYHNRYGTDAIPLRDFVVQHAAHVHHRNIADVLPAVSVALG